MTVLARWSIAATRRIHGLAEGPCAPRTARYDFAGGGTVTVPLELPLGPPATAGRTVMMLPAPPGGSLVERAVLFAEDGTEIMEIRCDPPKAAGDSGTWQVAVEAPRDIFDMIDEMVAFTDAEIEERLQETLRRAGYARGDISGNPQRKD